MSSSSSPKKPSQAAVITFILMSILALDKLQTKTKKDKRRGEKKREYWALECICWTPLLELGKVIIPKTD